MNALSVLKDAIRAVPAVRYALGIAGVGAGGALVAGFFHDYKVAIFGTLIMIAFMFVLVAFSAFTKYAPKTLRPLVLCLAWAFVVLTILASIFLLTGFFFSWPRSLESYVPNKSLGDISSVEKSNANSNTPSRKLSDELTPYKGPPSTPLVFAQDCPWASSVPCINCFPVTFGDKAGDCKDYPLLTAKLVSDERFLRVPELKDGIAAHAGDKIILRVYLHNSATTRLDPSITTVKNLKMFTELDKYAGSAHFIKLRVTSDNFQPLKSSLLLRTNAKEKIEFVPHGGYIKGADDSWLGTFEFSDNGTQLGHLRAGFENSIFLIFEAIVIESP
jgi:hypothetical protein